MRVTLLSPTHNTIIIQQGERRPLPTAGEPRRQSVLQDCCVELIGRRGEILDPSRPGELPARGDELATRARRRPG